MPNDTYMWTIFCDDVRQEAGNKLSYMGIYGANLVVPSFPTTLLKLCLAMSIRTKATNPPKSIIVRVLRDDELIHEQTLDDAALIALTQAPEPTSTNEKHLTVGAIVQLLNFAVTERCFVKARAIVDGEELKGGALELMSVETQH